MNPRIELLKHIHLTNTRKEVSKKKCAQGHTSSRKAAQGKTCTAQGNAIGKPIPISLFCLENVAFLLIFTGLGTPQGPFHCTRAGFELFSIVYVFYVFYDFQRFLIDPGPKGPPRKAAQEPVQGKRKPAQGTNKALK